MSTAVCSDLLVRESEDRQDLRKADVFFFFPFRPSLIGVPASRPRDSFSPLETRGRGDTSRGRLLPYGRRKGRRALGTLVGGTVAGNDGPEAVVQAGMRFVQEVEPVSRDS